MTDTVAEKVGLTRLSIFFRPATRLFFFHPENKYGPQSPWVNTCELF